MLQIVSFFFVVCKNRTSLSDCSDYHTILSYHGCLVWFLFSHFIQISSRGLSYCQEGCNFMFIFFLFLFLFLRNQCTFYCRYQKHIVLDNNPEPVSGLVGHIHLDQVHSIVIVAVLLYMLLTNF